MRAYTQSVKLGHHRQEFLDRNNMYEIVKSISKTIGEVNEYVVGRWDTVENSKGSSDSGQSGSKKVEMMNYLIESAIERKKSQCAVKMTTVKENDYLLDLYFPDPVEAA